MNQSRSISGGNHAVKGLPGAFDDASPDRWGRHIITKRLQAEARQFGQNAETLTALDFLLGVSDRTRRAHCGSGWGTANI
ncbi:hypothetical protein QK290_15170 [Pseudarthrobacter sp. AL07]|uniref:hypothetical protein n=1 Tax=Pseudarthrobacter sp. AL20 TaxID=3042239 RepID=UPI00249A5AFC|nr:hypothetical protein [Pseudarthrobacter sp. AL20]MDI3195644.1 hypothetical protein [Pseudarthrobacter sp. AL20]MDI3209807.1 hypothetical protein [Pseudarthrobacter sp. AL07]